MSAVDVNRGQTWIERRIPANCAAVLKPGGLLVLTTPNLLFGPNRLLMLAGKRPRFVYADFHVRMFVWDDLRAKISRRFGSRVLLGMRHSRLFEIFAVLGTRSRRSRPTSS